MKSISNTQSNSKFLDWLGTIPFLFAFTTIMICSDLAFRLSCILGTSFKARVFAFVNFSTVWLLKNLCGMKINFNLESKGGQSEYPKLIISNHQSLMDIPFTYVSYSEFLPRYISKKELSKFFPFVSVALRNMEHALIDRKNRLQATEEIKRFAGEMPKFKYAAVLFPEGTRARNGKLAAFKHGGFVAMLQELKKVEVLPIVIDNSWKITANKMLPLPYGLEVNVKLLPPKIISADDDLKEFLDNLNQQFAKELAS